MQWFGKVAHKLKCVGIVLAGIEKSNDGLALELIKDENIL